MVDRYLIRYFLAVVEQGSFSKAASRCGVSQPTLSVGIAKLETLLGRTVFERSSRRVELTSAGERFAAHARRIEADFIAAEQDARDEQAGKLIRLGIASTMPSAWIERAVRRVVDEGGTERLEIVEGRQGELAMRLDRGRIDAILGPFPPRPASRFLYEEGFAMAFRAGHRLAGAGAIGAADLAGETMIIRRNCEALAETSRFFTSHGIRPFLSAKTMNDDRAMAYVRAGLATTLVPWSFGQPGIALVPLTQFAVTRSIRMVFADASVARAGTSPVIALLGETLLACHHDRQGA